MVVLIYKDFQDLKLSALGFGAMRLPTVDGVDAQVDEPAAKELVDYAMAHGINYYDTAWGYHGGHSEALMGRCLHQYPRQSYYLASKFPGYDLSNMGKVQEIFEEQLHRCGVEYFDFYLFHNVCEMNIEQYLDPQYGIFDYLTQQKTAGRIRHLGLSVHGSIHVLERFLEAYGEAMEFCQVQLNYLDWEFQDAREKVALLERYHIPVWVMEPVRGGRLCQLSEEESAALRALRPEESQAGWAFRFLQSIPSVGVTLSGMSTIEQLQENLSFFETEQPLSQEEWDVLQQTAQSMVGGVPCTSCHYCTSHCSQELDIPMLLKLYNEHTFTGGGFLAPMALSALPADKQPSACVACRACEAVCPQQIKISDVLADFSQKLRS